MICQLAEEVGELLAITVVNFKIFGRFIPPSVILQVSHMRGQDFSRLVPDRTAPSSHRPPPSPPLDSTGADPNPAAGRVRSDPFSTHANRTTTAHTDRPPYYSSLYQTSPPSYRASPPPSYRLLATDSIPSWLAPNSPEPHNAHQAHDQERARLGLPKHLYDPVRDRHIRSRTTNEALREDIIAAGYGRATQRMRLEEEAEARMREVEERSRERRLERALLRDWERREGLGMDEQRWLRRG